MKTLFTFVIAVLVMLLATSCAANDSSSQNADSEITGPAFVLFYTEN